MTLTTSQPTADQQERSRRLRQCAVSIVVAPAVRPSSEAASIFCRLEDAHGVAGGPHFANHKTQSRGELPDVSVSTADMSQPAPAMLFPPIVLLPHLGKIPTLPSQRPAAEKAMDPHPTPSAPPAATDPIERRIDPAQRFVGPFPVADGCRRLRDAILHRVTATPCSLACLHLGTSPLHAPRLAELALALAEVAEGDVLLVDADFGAFGISRLFGVEDRAGLSEVLRDGRPWREAAHDTALKRVQIMPTGLAISTALYAAAADGLGVLLDELKKTFRFVLIAASAHQSRIAEWTWAVDGAIVAVELGALPRPELLEQIAFLRRDGARLTACAVYGGA
jgi:hypothetical protein